MSNVLVPARGGGTRSFLHFGRRLAEAGLRVAAVCGGPEIKAFEYRGIDVAWVVHDDDVPDAIRGFDYGAMLCQQRWAPAAAEEARAAGRPYWYFLRSTEDLAESRPGVYGVAEVAAAIRENAAAEPVRVAAELVGGAQRVVANSRFMGELVRLAFGRTCDVVYPGIDPPEAWEKRRTALSRHVVSMGGSAKKGVHLVIELARAFPAERFVLCGVKRLPSSIKVKELPANVHWLGQLSPRAAYGMAKVVLMPSQWPEPAGRVCPEAMMRGIPVLASRVGGIPEIVAEDGFLVDDFTSAAAWKRALADLLGRLGGGGPARRALELGDRYAGMQRVSPEMVGALRRRGS